jgi:hypothetical protein
MSAKLAIAALAVIALSSATPAYSKACPGDASKQTCCSAKNCGGKVLSNRDQHNCIQKSKGKSWHPAGGACVNL